MHAALREPRPPAVNKMVCEDCGTVYYSAAARTMVERGEPCPNCGGKLVLANGPRPAGPDWGGERTGGGPSTSSAA
jgi:DNA-directed RNA polymerase subunit RPC12/RpoP